MTDNVRTASHQYLIDARLREADQIKAAVHAYVVSTRDLPYEARRDTDRRKSFVAPFFEHLSGIEKAFVVAQAILKISDVVWKIERERLGAKHA